METEATTEFENSSMVRRVSETVPLLGEGGYETIAKKPFYRARPLWLVPFAVTAAVVRGMTLAPRIEIYTQLSCSKLRGDDRYHHTQISTSFSNPDIQPAAFYLTLDPSGPQLHPHHSSLGSYNLTFPRVAGPRGDTEEDPRRLPSARCISDPAVQAGAARLQTTVTTTMGLLSALTTGWWGHFSERHGRIKVLAISTFGLFMTDLIFILVSTPSSPLSSHGHRFLLLAPMIEGLLGGWSTLQSATSAYLSDCTSSGSRASIFSRFSGVFYIGLSVGPSLGGYLIRNPIWTHSEPDGVPTVTSVFWVAIVCSFINFILVLFVFPESLDKLKGVQAASRLRAETNVKGIGRAHDLQEARVVEGSEGNMTHRAIEETGILRKFLKPLRLFLPALVLDGGLRQRKDWNLTILGMASFGYMLAQGAYQLKYLYAEHIYGWGVEQLSYYISFLGITTAVFLLLLLPWIITTFKSKSRDHPTPLLNQGKMAQLTKGHLTREMSFDLVLMRASLVIELLSNALVVLNPLPSYEAHSEHPDDQSQALFVAATSLSSLGSGATPAMQSLALCMLQIRFMDSASSVDEEGKGVGELFGALAVLQSVGQTIIGPMLFGLVYSGTVAKFPKAVFVTAASILLSSLTMLMFIRVPTTPVPDGKMKARDSERGRSRVNKDLRGGAMYGCIAGSSSV